jgi:hypothetical protein
MTTQHSPETTDVGEDRNAVRRRTVRRWLIPVGVVAVAAAGVIAIAQHRDEIPTRTISGDTRSQVLVQEAIDAALAEHRLSAVTRSQVLVQEAIDAALVEHRLSAVTRSQVLVQKAIDAALAEAHRSG